jgi:DNA (cytosine-5)-methyltransferase 1
MRKHSFLTVTNQFCGAGGSSIGAVAAGAQLSLALNHWKLAIETHNTNFPDAAHDCTDISACDPRRYPSTDILITSPECTNHSLAKGKKRKDQAQLELWKPTEYDPSEERSRATMWDVPRFAEYHDYNLIVVENVVDARQWRLFDAWLKAMHDLDYLHEIVYFNSQFAYPTPQSRDRMYVIFWKRGNPAPDLKFTPPAFCSKCGKDVESVQSWKTPGKHWGRYRFQYNYRCPHCNAEVEPYFFCAANAIDWSLPAQRIGDRARPLKEKTLARIRAGLERYKNQALLVGLYGPQGQRVSLGTAENPFATLTASRTWGAVIPPASLLLPDTSEALAPMPFLVSLNHSTDRIRPLSAVMPTVMTYCTPSLLIPDAMDEQAKGELTPVAVGPGQSRTIPAFLLSYYTRLSGSKAAIAGLDEAVPTVPGWAVHYLASPGASPMVEDCGFRMLQPSEIQIAMAFPDSYIILGNQRMQIRQLGNAVTPPVMRMLLERCVATLN